MNIRYIINAVRRFGIKGIIDYFFRKPKERAFRRYLESTLRSEAPERGVTLIACFDYPGSLSKVMRDFAIMLKQAGIPYQTLNISCNNPIPRQELEFFLTPENEFCLNKYSHIITMRDARQYPATGCKTHCIEFWELEDGFVECCPEALRAQNVLALSDFNHNVFRKLLPPSIGVQKILYPFQFRHSPLAPSDVTREKYGMSTEDFVVFFNFDYTSSYFRKNPEGILQAFSKALKKEPNVKIVFKTMRAKACKAMSDRLRALACELGLSKNLITIDNFIPQEDLANLTNACDVYMSLHRGEGFGLGIAEAMSLGKAVIVTDYSSTTEFCSSTNAMLVPYELVPIRPEQLDNDAYRYATLWAEPDIDSAAKALRKLYDDSAYREDLGRRACANIKKLFSIDNFRKSVEEFLDAN